MTLTSGHRRFETSFIQVYSKTLFKLSAEEQIKNTRFYLTENAL